MTKKRKTPAREHRKLGRGEAIKPTDLLDRYRSLKQFFESAWGRNGLDLCKVDAPEDIRTALQIIPRVEWYRSFHEQEAKCLLAEGDTSVSRKECKTTEKRLKFARKEENRLSREFQDTSQRANQVEVALKREIDWFGPVIGFLPFIAVLILVAQRLKFPELAMATTTLETQYREARDKRKALEDALLSQNGWYARNEIVKFVQDDRYEKSAINFARASAGLPEYSWIYSLRKCLKLKDESLSHTNLDFQLFEVVNSIITRMYVTDPRKIEARLREELLKVELTMLRAYVDPHWNCMKQALRQCEGKPFKRIELPYKIMSGFFTERERAKTPLEIELANQERLTSADSL